MDAKAHDPGGLLSSYRVLDLCGVRGAWCGRILADLGADVIKVEPPEGDPARKLPPFANRPEDDKFSLYFATRNMNKRSITLNLEKEEGRGLFLRLLASADIMVEDAAPGYYEGLGLGYKSLAAKYPGLIVTSITDYGQSGPCTHRPGGSAMVAAAFGGLLHRSGYYEKPPCSPPGDLAYFFAGTMATTATLIAILARRRSGQGQHVDLSAVDAVGVCDWGVPNYSTTRAIQPRNGPGALYPIVKCRDGYVRILGSISPRQFMTLRKWLGDPEVLQGPEWLDLRYRGANHDLIDILMEEKTRDKTMVELYEEGQMMGLAITPVYQVQDILKDKQYRGRKTFVKVRQSSVGTFRAQRDPIRPSPAAAGRLQAVPRVGQHNGEILRGELGLTRADMVRLKKQGVIASSSASVKRPQEMLGGKT